jgi:hypothetical protein
MLIFNGVCAIAKGMNSCQCFGRVSRPGVGRIAFDWIDPNRGADMAEDRSPHSELMVYVWYPMEATGKEVKGILFPGANEINSAAGCLGFPQGEIVRR